MSAKLVTLYPMIAHICTYKKKMNKNFKDYEFKSTGVGVKHGTKPVSVMLPPELDEIVRSLPNRSQFIREAIAEKVKKEIYCKN